MNRLQCDANIRANLITQASLQ